MWGSMLFEGQSNAKIKVMWWSMSMLRKDQGYVKVNVNVM